MIHSSGKTDNTAGSTISILVRLDFEVLQVFVFYCFLCKTFRNLNHVSTLDSQSHWRVFSGGVVALKCCGVRRPYLYVPSVSVGASSVLFNRRLLCQVMFHYKHFEITLVRNEII